MSDFEKQIHAMFDHIWDCDINHPIFEDTVGDLMNAVIQCHHSARAEIDQRKIGEWDMFELITSAWYGKQYYFKESEDIVYSRLSHKYMTVDDAIKEFLGEITDDGSD